VAIDDLPLPVVNFLNVIGVPWPYVNEDTVTQFATLVREFRQAVRTTHQDATETVAAISRAHQSASTERMRSGWSRLSGQHVTEITDGCSVLADALDAAAGYIVAQKAEAVGVLIGLAASFAADQAASIVTLGLAEAALPAIIEGARLVVKSLIEDLQQYVIGRVIEAAAKPLFAKAEAALAGLDWSHAGTAGGAAPTGFTLDPAAVAAQTAALRGHAAELRAHAATFRSGVAGLSF
jgi:hypothetical protein